MKKSYYLFNPGRLSRKDNTLCFIAVNENGDTMPAKYLPVEGVDELFVFGSLDVNSALLNFLGQHSIPAHFFDYYENYTGSYMPREYLLAGKMQIAQTEAFLDTKRRLHLAQSIVHGAAVNMVRNLKYYDNRGKDLLQIIETIERFQEQIPSSKTINELMGMEGNIRQTYYQAFDSIIRDFNMEGRSKRPPQNEINALISFGNMMCYTTCLKQIYHTQLNPTISFLHTPGTRRYSLALDIAELFKPVLVDRVIFKLLNKGMIKENDFHKETNQCLLKETGKRVFIQNYQERLDETIQHTSLKRKVSYNHLIKLECYKLTKHLLGMETYQPFKMRW